MKTLSKLLLPALRWLVTSLAMVVFLAGCQPAKPSTPPNVPNNDLPNLQPPRAEVVNPPNPSPEAPNGDPNNGGSYYPDPNNEGEEEIEVARWGEWVEVDGREFRAYHPAISSEERERNARMLGGTSTYYQDKKGDWFFCNASLGPKGHYAPCFPPKEFRTKDLTPTDHQAMKARELDWAVWRRNQYDGGGLITSLSEASLLKLEGFLKRPLSEYAGFTSSGDLTTNGKIIPPQSPDDPSPQDPPKIDETKIEAVAEKNFLDDIKKMGVPNLTGREKDFTQAMEALNENLDGKLMTVSGPDGKPQNKFLANFHNICILEKDLKAAHQLYERKVQERDVNRFLGNSGDDTGSAGKKMQDARDALSKNWTELKRHIEQARKKAEDSKKIAEQMNKRNREIQDRVNVIHSDPSKAAELQKLYKEAVEVIDNGRKAQAEVSRFELVMKVFG